MRSLLGPQWIQSLRSLSEKEKKINYGTITSTDGQLYICADKTKKRMMGERVHHFLQRSYTTRQKNLNQVCALLQSPARRTRSMDALSAKDEAAEFVDPGVREVEGSTAQAE